MIPLTHALVREERAYPHSSSQLKKIILIQDIHLNLEAQQNIAYILQTLIDQKGIDLVGVEGAFGELQFERFRSHPDQGSYHRC